MSAVVESHRERQLKEGHTRPASLSFSADLHSLVSTDIVISEYPLEMLWEVTIFYIKLSL